MINITLNQVRLLKSLSLGERFPLSNLKGKTFNSYWMSMSYQSFHKEMVL